MKFLQNRWNYWKLIWSEFGKRIFVFVWIGFGAYDLVVSQFIIPNIQDKFPNTAEVFTKIDPPWWGTLLVLLLMLMIFIFEGSYRFHELSDVEKALAKLGEFRRLGVQLWHEGKTKLSPETVEDWWGRHLEWREECASLIEQVDPELASEMRTLGIGTGLRFNNGISKDHNHKIWMQSAWNNRLEEIMGKLRHLGKS